MEKLPKCPYSVSQSIGFRPYPHIREDYEFQYNENHEAVAVKVGETDLLKEINSHVNEVGLVNVIKMAIAHGENPVDKFKKTEDGVMFSIDPDATIDDIRDLQASNDKKLEEIAKSLNISVDDLYKHMNDGTINKVIEAAAKPAEKEGD